MLVSRLIWLYISRSAMNAFLSVSLLKLPVSSLQEVHNMKYDMLMWKNGFLEGHIR